MRIVGNNPQLSRQTQATASGAITGGKPVVVNTDGTVSLVALNTTPALGTAVSTFGGNKGPALCKLTDTTFLVTGRDSTNSYTATTSIGTVSNGSISFGTKAAISAIGSTVNVIVPVRLTDNKFVLLWTDSGDVNKGKAIVGTVSSGSITYGSAVTFESGQTGLNIVNAGVALTTTKFIIAFEDVSNSSYAKAIVGNVSGTSISFGTAVTYNTANSSKYGVVDKLTDTKVIIAYSETPQGERGRALVATISGTSISFGSQVTYDDGGSLTVVNHSIVALSETQFVISYLDKDESNYGRSIVGSVSGTTVSMHNTTNFNGAANAAYIPTSVKINSTQFAIAFSPSSPSNTRKVIIGTVASNTATFASAVTFNGGSGSRDSVAGMTLLGTSDLLIGWRPDETESPVVDYLLQSANITSENFIGFAQDTVATGQPVTINTKGAIVDNIPQLESASDTLGDAVTFHTGNVNGRMTYDSNSKRIVLAYRNGSNSGYGTAVVGTSGTSPITFGTPVVYESADTTATHIAFDSNVNRVLVAYRDEGNSDYGTAIVGNVDPSDNSISFGTPAVFHSAGIADTKIVFDSNTNKFFISFRDSGDSNKGKGVVATIDSSDNSVTFGSVATFHSGTLSNHGTAFDSNVNKIFISFADSSSGDGSYCVGTISGTSISFSTVADFITASAGLTKVPFPVFDSNVNRIVIFFSDGENSDNFSAIVGTVAANSSVSFGTKVQISTSNTQYHFSSFDTNTNKIFVTVNDGATTSSQSDAVYYFGTVDASDNSISFSTKADFVTNTGTSYGAIFYNYPVFDSDSGKTIVSYTTGDFAKGQVKALIPAGTLEDLTPAQQYFVQTDGTLSETADDPSITAGTAVAGSTLIVKG